ncbi:MAG: NTP transferase domain-containing protein [Nitrososphaerales archaeon]|nr:NTP transferase domain-containing protein [Nitrososphaerales archaeon]
MGISALIMAGGKGTRMRGQEEKPLLKIFGKPLIEHVLDALKDAREVTRIVVATSKHTPKTAKRARELSLEVIQTSGKDYHVDMREAIKKLNLRYVITVSADLPLLKGKTIDKIVKHYKSCGKPVMAVMVPAERFKGLGVSIDLILEDKGRRLVPAGINVLDGDRVKEERFEKELDQELLVIDSEEFLNTNTPQDIMITERLLSSMSKK